MEIRNTLLKLENYLAVVTNLNKTILSEGTMSPEELQLMKKHLYICIDKIEEVESKLGLTIDDVFDKQKASAVQLEEETIVQETVIPQEITIQIPNDLKLQQEKLPSIAIEHEPIWDLFATKIEEKELVLADVYQSNHQFENNIEEKTIVNNNAFDDDFLVEQKSNTLVADDEHKEELFFNNDLKDKVESTITEVENKVESVIENTHQTNNLLVAEDEEKEALFFNNDLKDKAELTITEVENKAEFVVENTHQTNNLLVAEDEEKAALFFNNDLKDKVESTITEVENKIESLVENTHQTNNLLVAEDEEKEALFFSNDLKDKVESTITEVENKVKSVVENTHQTNNLLVAEDEEKAALFFNNDLKDKIESTINEVENKVESVVEDTHQTNNLLVAEDEEKAALFFNNDLKDKAESTITEVENKVESVVENTHQTKSDFNLEFITDEDDNMHIAVPEFDINRKSFSENISLNEKFIFVRELFNSQFTAYEKELKKLDEMNSYQEAAQYCNTTLSDTYNWKAAQKQDNVNKFMNLLEQQFQY